MAYSVETTASYDARFEAALAYRLQFAGRTSALRLLEAQEAAEERLQTFPRIGTPLDPKTENPGGDIVRWFRLDCYIAVYETYADDERVIMEDLFYASENWREKV